MRRGPAYVGVRTVSWSRRTGPVATFAGTPGQPDAAGGTTWSLPAVRRSALLVILGIATVVARLHELVAPLRLIRPIFVVIALVAMGTLAARREAGIRSALHDDPSMRLLYAYWAWMIATIPSSIDRGNSASFVLNIALIVVFATMVAAQPPSLEQARRITRGFFVTTAAFALILVLRGTPTMDEGGLRYSITASLDPNDCAGFLAMGAPMALAELRRRGPWAWRLVAFASFVTVVLGVVRTGSRGGFIAMAAGVVLVLLAGRGVRMIVAIVGIMFAGLTVVQLAPSLLPARIAAMGDIENDYNLTLYGGRVQIWKRATKYFAEDPVLGVGVNNFPAREGLQMLEDGQPGRWSAPHSAYVQSFVELGLVGGLLFCGAILVSLGRVARFYRTPSRVSGVTHPEYFAAVVAFSISAIFLSHAYFWGFFALVALCALADRSLPS